MAENPLLSPVWDELCRLAYERQVEREIREGAELAYLFHLMVVDYLGQDQGEQPCKLTFKSGEYEAGALHDWWFNLYPQEPCPGCGAQI